MMEAELAHVVLSLGEKLTDAECELWVQFREQRKRMVSSNTWRSSRSWWRAPFLRPSEYTTSVHQRSTTYHHHLVWIHFFMIYLNTSIVLPKACYQQMQVVLRTEGLYCALYMKKKFPFKWINWRGGKLLHLHREDWWIVSEKKMGRNWTETIQNYYH